MNSYFFAKLNCLHPLSIKQQGYDVRLERIFLTRRLLQQKTMEAYDRFTIKLIAVNPL